MKVNPRVRDLTPYVPGKPPSELFRELGIDHAIKLASNENPRGPSERVREVLRKSFADLNRYPDGSGFDLKVKLAEHLSVAEEQITLGNGSNDVLELAARVALEPGDEAIVDEHCFVVYPLAIASAHGTQISTRSKSWGTDLEAIADAITPSTRLIYVANPNNPTGTWVKQDELVQFLDVVRDDIWVVLDEAYFEYACLDPTVPDGVELTKHYPNLVVTRTFSKVYGLAGLRIGYAISSPQFADFLNRIRQPFNANTLALAAAETALSHNAYVKESVELNSVGMKFLTEGLAELGFVHIPSRGNFITFKLGSQTDRIYNELLRKGVIVRPIANYDMPEHLRVTIGTEKENSIFLRALKECV